MDIGPEKEVVEVTEPAVPFEGEEVDPDFRPEKEKEPAEETVPA